MKERGIGLVYGGGNWGLMGVVGREAHSLGVELVGVIPKFMEVTAGQTYGQVEWVETMAERKLRMCQLVHPA